uniref:Uncharacterized protein n=1 Tax=Fagus sylvatica TaxID=28930 RepID=A0A2N9EV34_FAGSY
MTQSEISKPIHKRSNQKNYHLICAFCKHRGHTIDRCNMRAGILQRSAALTASESIPSSDAASLDPVSLTTPTYSIADLQALFSQVQALSSNASNSALSVTPGISSEWFLDSACCNHMTDNPHLTSAHTPPVLPTITTADGSAMTVSHVGSISTPNLSISDVFCVPKLHLNLLSVGQLTELGLNLFFSSRGCLVQDSRTRQIVGSARKVGQLFELCSSDAQIMFEMKDLGPLSYFLGLEVSSSSDGYYLTQAKYTSDLISRAGITDSKIVDTPIEYNNRLNTHDGEPLPDATLYRQLVGSLVYLTVTRPDISYAVHIVSQFMAAPRSLHYAALLRILRYLKGTLFHGLHFSSQSSLTLQAYSDADWAGDPTDRRSTTRYCFLLGDSLISWRSKKQSVVTRSSTKAEYRALSDTIAELFWLRWLLQDLGIDCSTAVLIHCDNRSAIQIAHNDVFHERTKHIEIDCHFVRHHLLQGTLQLRSVSSQDQLADIFTKPMPPGRFRDLISKLKLVSVHPT